MPVCPRCHWHPLRPDVVLFGEHLPWPVMAEAESALHRADMLMVIGTSGAVSSATSTIDSAAAYGVHCVLINKEPWERPHPDVAETLIGPAEEILPHVVALSEVRSGVA